MRKQLNLLTTSLLATLLIFVACRKESINWNSNYAVPVIKDRLTLNDLVNDTTITVDTNNNFQVNLERELVRLDLSDIVKIPDTTISESYAVPVAGNIPPGFEFVNEIEENVIELGDILLKEVGVKKGVFEVELSNPYPTDVLFRLELIGVSKNQVPFVVEEVVGPGTNNNPTSILKEYSFEGYTMDLTGISGGESNVLQSRITVKSDENGPAVYSTPSFMTTIHAKIKDLNVDYARGYFGQQTLKDTVTTNIEVMNIIQGGYLDLPNIDLDLTLTNGVKVDGRLKIAEVIGTNVNGQTVSLQHVGIGQTRNVNRALGAYQTLDPSELNYSFNSTNSNIEAFLENLPKDIQVVYELEINPNGNISGSNDEFFPNSFISFDLDFEMPLAPKFNPLTLSDTLEANFTGLLAVVSKVNEAEIALQFQNAFPIALTGDLVFLDENDEALMLIESIEVKSPEGSVNAIDGQVVGESQLTVELNREQILGLPFVRSVFFKVRLNSMNDAQQVSSTNQVNANDFLDLKIQLFLDYAHAID